MDCKPVSTGRFRFGFKIQRFEVFRLSKIFENYLLNFLKFCLKVSYVLMQKPAEIFRISEPVGRARLSEPIHGCQKSTGDVLRRGFTRLKSLPKLLG